MSKVFLGLAVVVCAGGIGSVVHADAQEKIAGVEALPRTRRLAEYERLAADRTLSAAERTVIIKAFAKHASKVSPVYGKSTHRIDANRWQLMLEYAYQQDPQDAEILFALCQLLIDQKRYDEAIPFAQAFLKTRPKDHFAIAWSEYCRSKTSVGTSQRPPLLTFPLHFCVLTSNPQAQHRATLAQCQKEVDIFNRSFLTIDGRSLVRFVFKSYTSYVDARESTCDLLEFGGSTTPYRNDAVTKAFNTCEELKIRDPHAINVYIYDSYSARARFGDQTSHGIRNSNRPFLLIDWQRLGSTSQNAEPHEMGHAFGLGHVGVPGATGRTSTNIMASIGESFGSGGLRDLGFSEAQSAVVLYHAGRTYERLNLP